MYLLGFFGLLLILAGEGLSFFPILPWAQYVFPLFWYGYILVLDSLNYRLRGTSLLSGRRREFLLMLPISATYWYIFEWYNLVIENWVYLNTPAERWIEITMKIVSFATVIPAVYETADLLAAILQRGKPRTTDFRLWPWDAALRGSPDNLFPHSRAGRSVVRPGGYLRPELRSRARQVVRGKGPRIPPLIPSNWHGLSLTLGLLLSILPLLLPKFFFWSVWLGLFFLIDPINDRLHRSSILNDWHSGDPRRTALFLIAGYVCGFFWEFWNYWAYTKWIYTVPIAEMPHIFEMPILGFLGFGPFALETFAFWTLVWGNEKVLK